MNQNDPTCDDNDETRNRPCYYFVNYHLNKINNSIVLESARCAIEW